MLCNMYSVCSFHLQSVDNLNCNYYFQFALIAQLPQYS